MTFLLSTSDTEIHAEGRDTESAIFAAWQTLTCNDQFSEMRDIRVIGIAVHPDQN